MPWWGWLLVVIFVVLPLVMWGGTLIWAKSTAADIYSRQSAMMPKSFGG